MTFHQPSIWLLLLLLVVAAWLWRRSRRRRPAIAFASLSVVAELRPTLAMRLLWLVPALRALALATLVVCVARPQKPDEHTRVTTEGIAIELVIDRSESMLEADFVLDGRRTSRLEAVKAVVREFVVGGEGLPGRPDDLIGLISFASFPDSICPMTIDHSHLVDSIGQVRVSADRNDRATAMGDALALAVERMRALSERADFPGAQRIKSQVVILLSDGENTAGELDPLTAADLAAHYGMKLYTIGAGGEGAYREFAGVRLPMGPGVDERTLRAMAEKTGGRYFRATDTSSLRQVYAAIDELERTRIEQKRYADYHELSVQSARLWGVPLPPLLTIPLIALLIEIALASTRLRRLP